MGQAFIEKSFIYNIKLKIIRLSIKKKACENVILFNIYSTLCFIFSENT